MVMVYYNIPAEIDLDRLSFNVFLLLAKFPTYGGKEKKVKNNNIIRTRYVITDSLITKCYAAPICFNNGKERQRFEGIKYYIGHLLSMLSRIDYIKDDYREIYCNDLKLLHDDEKHINAVLKRLRVINHNPTYMPKLFSIDGQGRCMMYGLKEEYRSNYKRVDANSTAFFKTVAKIKAKDFGQDASITEEQVLEYQYNIFKNECVVVDPDWTVYKDTDASTATEIERSLAKFKQRVFNVKSSPNVKRVSSTITLMPKDGRSFIRYKKTGESFVSLDISASHFTFLSFIMDLDREKLLRMISTDFYSHLANVGGHPRKLIKSQSFKYLYGSNYKFCSKVGKNILAENEMDKCMKRELPALHAYVYGMKKSDKKRLAQQIMKLEADVVVRKIGGRLMQMNIPFYTIHDCVCCLENDVKTVVDVMTSTMQQELNSEIVPKIKIERPHPVEGMFML